MSLDLSLVEDLEVVEQVRPIHTTMYNGGTPHDGRYSPIQDLTSRNMYKLMYKSENKNCSIFITYQYFVVFQRTLESYFKGRVFE